MKVDATVISETRYIAIWVLLFSVLMEAVFLILGYWDYTVVLGNILAMAAAIANFFLMGLTVQKAVLKEEKDAAALMKFSQRMRLLGLLAVAALGILLPCFHTAAVLLPLFFPRIAIAIRPLVRRDV